MPGLSPEQLPAAQQDPMGVLKGRLDQSERYLKSQYSVELGSIQDQMLSDQDFNNKLNSLNSKYHGMLNQERYRMDQQVKSVQRIQSLVKAGQVAPDAGQEAMWRMVLPRETEQAMFPTGQKGQKGLSIAQKIGGPLERSVLGFAEAASTIPKLFKSAENEPKTKPGLLEQYTRWRDFVNYDIAEPFVKRDLDMVWNQLMMSDERFDAWWSDKNKRKPIAEVKALQSQGRITGIMKDKLTPFGRSIVKEKSRGTVYGWGRQGMTAIPAYEPKLEQIVEQPTAQQLQRQNTREAYERGKKLGYWTE